MLKYLIPLFVFSAIVILFVFGLQNDPRIVPSPFIDKPLPDIELPLLYEPDRHLGTRDFAGEISLLNIWATWCIPCRQEHPLLVNLARENDVKIIGLNYKDDRDKAIRWLEDLGNPYDTVLFDESGTAGIDLGVYGVPETFIMDEDAIVRYKHIGPMSEKDMNEIIIPVINELKKPL
jgi:cytochrome c biogenesis protein CcmG/thiol:disulfide interchange protein DsbE